MSGGIIFFKVKQKAKMWLEANKQAKKAHRGMVINEIKFLQSCPMIGIIYYATELLEVEDAATIKNGGFAKWV